MISDYITNLDISVMNKISVLSHRILCCSQAPSG